MTNEDWASIAKPIGLELLGEPKSETSTEVRWGTHGSFCLSKKTGGFYSFELDQGGGTMWLLKHFDQDINETLKRFGFGDEGGKSNDLLISPNNVTPSSPSLTRDQFVELWLQASIKLKYSDSFAVLRFPEGHPRGHIKYSPFSKYGDLWYNKRPEGLLPLYVSDRSEDKPLLLCEGEKAAIAAEQIYAGQVACHHGGCQGWNKTDWSPIYGRQVYIYPDKDEAGLKFAEDISTYLRTNGCEVTIAKPHADLPEKGDLHEAKELALYSDSDALENYIKNTPVDRPKGALYFERADLVMSQVDNPDWLIKTVAERSSLLGVFGAPKSGKSFVAIAMAAAIANGSDFYGHKAKRAPVVYLCGEGKRGVKRRLAAWNQSKEPLDGAPLFLSNRGTRILDPDEYAKLIAELDMIEAQEGDLSCIIFDTLNRNFGAGSENSTEDMTLFISRMDELIHKYEAAVIIVHHTGHTSNGRQRGSSVLGASMDYEFKIERTDDTKTGDTKKTMFVTMEQTLNKDGMGMEKINFEFKEVELLGFDDLTSGYLEVTDHDIKRKFSTRGTHIEVNRALKSLANDKAIKEGGNEEDYTFSISELVGVCKTQKGKDMSRPNIAQYIGEMVNIEQVINLEDKYQSIEYKKVVKYSDNFDVK
jgi:hypothetical protein